MEKRGYGQKILNTNIDINSHCQTSKLLKRMSFERDRKTWFPDRGTRG